MDLQYFVSEVIQFILYTVPDVQNLLLSHKYPTEFTVLSNISNHNHRLHVFTMHSPVRTPPNTQTCHISHHIATPKPQLV